ncbi:hypothetical protein LN451_19885, partial [Xanthomonas hortorum pv. gardneri]|uniref:hypothetical protein n=1 Tax=Xanthomonas hortorum TaxID=56454 RepID=UPI001E47BC34
AAKSKIIGSTSDPSALSKRSLLAVCPAMPGRQGPCRKSVAKPQLSHPAAKTRIIPLQRTGVT